MKHVARQRCTFPDTAAIVNSRLVPARPHRNGCARSPRTPGTASNADGGAGRRPRRGDVPNLITNVATTTATVPDAAMTAPIHQQQAAKGLAPDQHLVDSGYPSADIIVAAARLHGITLVSPMLLDHSAQARAGQGYHKASFTIDFDARQATCPQGVTSASWSPARQRGTDAIVVSWSTKSQNRPSGSKMSAEPMRIENRS